MTTADYKFLADLAASIAHNFIGTMDQVYYSHLETRLQANYANFDKDKFRQAYLDRRQIYDIQPHQIRA